MERLTHASWNHALIAVGNVMSGAATDRAPRSAPEGYKKDGEWVRRCTVIDTGGALLAREDDGAGVT